MKTPLTDEAPMLVHDDEYVKANFARKLETDRARLMESMWRIIEGHSEGFVADCPVCQARALLKELS